MNIWNALIEQLNRGIVQSMVGLVVLAFDLLVNFISGRAKPHIRFHKIKDYEHNRVTFLIRNLDSVRFREDLVVRLTPRSAIERVSVHGGPYTSTPPVEDKDNVLITFQKVPADATFSIKVTLKPQGRVKIWLADNSVLRPRNFNDKLEAFRGVRRLSYFLMRGVAGFIGFVAVLMIGLVLDHDVPTWSDWPFVAVGGPLAIVVFVLVVPTTGKPIVAGYLGWSGASKDWSSSGS